MPATDPRDRSLIAQQAAHTRWSRTADRATATEAARKAALQRFERQVDPDGTLTPDVRAKMAENARKAYFLALSRKSAAARRRSGDDPPDLAPDTSQQHPLNDRSGAPRAEDLIRDGARILKACRLEYAPSWLARMARAYQSSGKWREMQFVHFLADRMTLSRQQMHSFLAYADPTGETAVGNVIRGSR